MRRYENFLIVASDEEVTGNVVEIDGTGGLTVKEYFIENGVYQNDEGYPIYVFDHDDKEPLEALRAELVKQGVPEPIYVSEDVIGYLGLDCLEA